LRGLLGRHGNEGRWVGGGRGRGGGGKSSGSLSGLRMKLPHVCWGVAGNTGTYIYHEGCGSPHTHSILMANKFQLCWGLKKRLWSRLIPEDRASSLFPSWCLGTRVKVSGSQPWGSRPGAPVSPCLWAAPGRRGAILCLETSFMGADQSTHMGPHANKRVCFI
jgi:hypothetical protein